MRRIAVINQKGGVGKTTTCVNLAAALARDGRRVLLIDLDPQAHLSTHLGLDGSQGPGTYELLTEHAPIRELIRPAEAGMGVIASRMDLAAAESELISVVGREVILKNRLAELADDYDCLLIDCPPSFSVLTLNALVAVDEIIVPLQAHFLGLQGVGRLLETVKLVCERLNPALRVAGFVLCMHESGTRLAGEVVDDLGKFIAAAQGQKLAWSDARIFDTRIRRNIKLAECPSFGQSIFAYAAGSHGAEDYLALAREVSGNKPASKPRSKPQPARRPTAAEAAPATPAAPVAPPSGAKPPARPRAKPAAPVAAPVAAIPVAPPATIAAEPIAPPSNAPPPQPEAPRPRRPRAPRPRVDVPAVVAAVAESAEPAATVDIAPARTAV